MKLVLLSDSHGNVANMADVVRLEHPDRVLHMGELARDAEAEPHARYESASLEETAKKDGDERVLASLKQVGVSMAVFFNEPEEGKEE